MEAIVEILGRVGFDWQVALANFVSFLVIFLIVKIWIWKPVIKIIDDRKAKIDKGLEQAEEAEAKLTNAQEESDKLRDQAKSDVATIISEGREEAAATKARIEEAAYEKEAEVLKQAEDKIAEEKRKMLEDVRSESVDLVLDTTAQILKEDFDKDKSDEYSKKAAELISK